VSILTGFNQLRNEAHQRAREVGLPTNRQEAWRHVNLHHLQEKVANTTGRKTEHYLPVARSAAPGVVLANGLYDPGAAGALPAGVTLHCLAGDSTDDPVLDAWRTDLAGYDDITACWTLADMKSALLLDVARTPAEPLLLINLATDGICAARVRLRLDAGVTLRLAVIHTVGVLGRSSLGIECELAAGSRLELDEVEAPDRALGEMGELFVHGWCRVAEAAELAWHHAGRGGSLVRRRLDIALTGIGAAASVGSAVRVGGESQSHHHLRMRHLAGGTRSRQLIRQVADEHGQAGFDGLVTIVPGADGSDAQQSCSCLLLDDRARVGVRPQLDIRADDVRAEHGANIGRHDEAQMLYLRSRGIAAETAADLLTRGFLEEALTLLASDPARGLARRQLGCTGEAA
jgi:Fe-S cluster assembly protein SufD